MLFKADLSGTGRAEHLQPGYNHGVKSSDLLAGRWEALYFPEPRHPHLMIQVRGKLMSFLGEETLCKVTSILQCVAHLSPALRVPFIWAHGNPRAELLSQAYQTEICSSLSMS